MFCYQLIITITISHKSKSFIQKELLIAVLNIVIKKMENSSQNGSLVSFKTVTTGDFTSTILQSQFLEMVTIVAVINVVIGRFSGEDSE